MHDVFISFSFKDQAIVDKISSGLEKNNISYWICTEQIRGGGAFYDEISEAITASKVLVYIQTKNSVESKEIPDEIFQALDEDKTIITFVVEDSELRGMMKLKLKSKQHVDARNGRLSAKIDELAREIKYVLGQNGDADAKNSSAEEKRSVALTSKEASGELENTVKKTVKTEDIPAEKNISKNAPPKKHRNALRIFFDIINCIAGYIILRMTAFPTMVSCIFHFNSTNNSDLGDFYYITIDVLEYLAGGVNTFSMWWIYGVTDPERIHSFSDVPTNLVSKFIFCIVLVLAVCAITVYMVVKQKGKVYRAFTAAVCVAAFMLILFDITRHISVISIVWFTLLILAGAILLMNYIKTGRSARVNK